MLEVILGCSGLGIEIDGRDREGNVISSFLGRDGVLALDFSVVGFSFRTTSTFGREILGMSNEVVCCGCCGGDGGGVCCFSVFFGNKEILTSGGGRNDFFC